MTTHHTHMKYDVLNASWVPSLSTQESTMTDRIFLPLPPELGADNRFEMDIYARFMRHLRQVPNSRMEIKILSSIQFTADMMDIGDELVAKVLVDLGLRAPRRAFPTAFLDFADRALNRRIWDCGRTPTAISALKVHWDRIGEDRFGPSVRTHYALYNDYLSA